MPATTYGRRVNGTRSPFAHPGDNLFLFTHKSGRYFRNKPTRYPRAPREHVMAATIEIRVPQDRIAKVVYGRYRKTARELGLTSISLVEE